MEQTTRGFLNAGQNFYTREFPSASATLSRGNDYKIFTESNLDTTIPSEIAPSVTKLLAADKGDYIYPALSATISRANNYEIYTDANLLTSNPPEVTAHSQVFKTTTYREVSYVENPNAFRLGHSLGQPNNLPDEKYRYD